MITTDTTNKLGTTVAKDLRTVMQGKVAIVGGRFCFSTDLASADSDAWLDGGDVVARSNHVGRPAPRRRREPECAHSAQRGLNCLWMAVSRTYRQL